MPCLFLEADVGRAGGVYQGARVRLISCNVRLTLRCSGAQERPCVEGLTCNHTKVVQLLHWHYEENLTPLASVIVMQDVRGCGRRGSEKCPAVLVESALGKLLWAQAG